MANLLEMFRTGGSIGGISPGRAVPQNVVALRASLYRERGFDNRGKWQDARPSVDEKIAEMVRHGIQSVMSAYSVDEGEAVRMIAREKHDQPGHIHAKHVRMWASGESKPHPRSREQFRLAVEALERVAPDPEVRQVYDEDWAEMHTGYSVGSQNHPGKLYTLRRRAR